MIGPCDVCRLLDGDTSPKPVRWAGCCAAWLCETCAGDYGRRFAAMRTRDGVGGGVAGWLRRTWHPLALLAAMLIGLFPGPAHSDTGVLWSLGPSTLTDQNRIAAGALISDSQIHVFRTDSSDAAGKQTNGYVTTDFGVSFQGAITSANAALATAAPSAILSAKYFPSRATFILAGVAASGTNAVLYGSGFTWAFATITGLTGTSPVAHSVEVAGSTVLMLVQTSAGGFICRATSPTATAISFTCQTPTAFGSVSALTSTTATGTVQGLAALPGSIWLAIDNANQTWRSSDDGVTWTRTNGAAVLTASTVLGNAIACASPSTCLALVSSSANTSIGVWRSTDFGVTWTRTLTVARADRVTNLVVVGQGVILALGDPYQTAVPMGYRSRDLGATWDPIPPQSLAVPIAGRSFVAHQSTWVTSTGVTVAVTTICAVADCTGQVVRAAIAPGTDPPFTAFQGPPTTLGNAWPVKLTDGTTGPVAVTAASTAATTAAPALVVALSPNSPLPAAASAATTLGTVAQGAAGRPDRPWAFRLVTAGGVDLITPPFVAATAADPALTVTMAVPSAPWPVRVRSGIKLGSFEDVTLNATTATLIRVASGSRVSLACTNVSATIAIRIGDSAVTATRGVRVPANASVTIDSADAVWGFAESGSPTISCTEDSRP